MGLLLHGPLASQALDSTSEILDIKGLDVSSLTVANYEHESKQASQICGKVLKSLKIFSPEDCEDQNQLLFWNRIKVPFLYGIIELFDDVNHSGAMDIAAIAQYDEKHKGEYDFSKTFPLLGASIEGSKINKEQNIITHSLARKVSLTITPANKTCFLEIYHQNTEQPPIQKKEKISKTRGILEKILKSENISIEQQNLIKSDIVQLDSLEKAAINFPTTELGVSNMGIEARRGDTRKLGVISHGYGRVTNPETHMGRAKSIATQTLKDIKAQPKPNLPKSEELIGGKGDNKPLSSFNNKQVKMGRTVEMEHTKSPKIAQEITADHLTEDPHYYSKLKDAGLADELEKTNSPIWSSRRAAIPIKKEKKPQPQWSSRRATNSMQKALTATASPLNPEILEPKMQRVTKSENIFDDLQKGEKELKAMYGANLQPHHEAFVKWATKSLPNQNWQEWAVKNHRENPKQFTPKVTKQLEHFGGSKHIPDIANVRLGDHNLKDGIQAFKDAEDSYNAKAISKPQIIKPSPKTEKIMDFGDGYAWFSLNKPACKKEGAAMGHCGNVPSQKKGQNVLSLRKIVNIGGKEYHEPAATFIKEPNNNEIGEMKGRANTVPSPKYHKYIKGLFEKTDLVPKGGGYLPGNNFHLDDLSHEDHDDLLSKRPDLAKYSNRVNPDLDPKHHEQLVNDENDDVKAAIASNPDLDPKHHEKLVNDDDSYVRRAIASNPNLDPKLHEQLVNDESFFVRWEIANSYLNNPNKTKQEKEIFLSKIKNDEHKEQILAEAKLQKLKEESDKNIAKRSERVKEYRNKITKSENIFKSEALDAAIPTWNLVEKFKEFIKIRVPDLSEKEANAFTRAFKIFKIKAAENKLKDL